MWISLIGFHGSGKSTLARELGRLSGRRVVDLDQAVVRLAGRPLPAIFATGGPDLCRDLEEQVLADLPARELLVLATGGGSLERAGTASLVRARGTVVWLDAAWPFLRRRLAPAAGQPPSPLWQHLGESGLALLYARRRPLFAAAARLRFDATSDPGDLARRLLGRCQQLAPAGSRGTP